MAIKQTDRTFHGGVFSAWVWIPDAVPPDFTMFRKGVVSAFFLFWPDALAEENEIDIELTVPRKDKTGPQESTNTPALVISTAGQGGPGHDPVRFYALDPTLLGTLAKLEMQWTPTPPKVTFSFNNKPLNSWDREQDVPNVGLELRLNHWISQVFSWGWKPEDGASLFEVVALEYPADPTPRVTARPNYSHVTELRSNIQVRNIQNLGGGIAIGQADFYVHDSGLDQVRIDLKTWSEGISVIGQMEIEKAWAGDTESSIVQGTHTVPVSSRPHSLSSSVASFVVQLHESGTTTYKVFVTPLGRAREEIGSFDLKSD